MRLFRKEEGFTLVELMVVVLIIGILVAVAIPVFNSASAAARRRACQANQRTLDGAVEQWVAADETHDKTTLDSLALAKAAIGNYVKDWDGAVTCPGGGTISVTDGNFSCSIADHEYEQ